MSNVRSLSHQSRRWLPTGVGSTRLVTCALVAVILCACAPGAPAPAAGDLSSGDARPRILPPYPTTPGPVVRVGDDRLQVLASGHVAFPVIREAIAAARRSVELEMYELARPDLAAALVDARRRGLQVTVVVDPSVLATAATALRLRAAGVDVLDYPVRKQMIDHVKLLVLDGGDVAVVGGINWNVTSAVHHDFDVLVRGPAAHNLELVVKRDLVTCGRMAAVGEPVVDPGVLVASTLPGTDIKPLVLDVLAGASRTLDVEVYVLTDTAVIHALERAHRRGVRVRVLLDPSQRPSDPAMAALRAAGVPAVWYRGHGELLHAKAAVADGRRVVFGSANWSRGGFERNHEVDLEVVDSPMVAAGFEAAIAADWAGSAGS